MNFLDLLILAAGAAFAGLLGAWLSLSRRRAAVVLNGRYELGDLLGYGAMGTVRRGYDRARGVRVAVKSPRAREPERSRASLREEARAAAALAHPNIVALLDVCGPAGAEHLVFEYAPGASAHALRRRSPQRRLSPSLTAKIISEAASALDYAHSRGIVHRDLKSANILVTDDGRVKLTDFGLARSADAAAGTACGTPGYMAPEQARGEAVFASDQYSLAACAQELLTGELPLPGASPSLPSQGVREVLARGLAPRPQDRFPDCRSFAAALARALDESAAPARPR